MNAVTEILMENYVHYFIDLFTVRKTRTRNLSRTPVIGKMNSIN